MDLSSSTSISSSSVKQSSSVSSSKMSSSSVSSSSMSSKMSSAISDISSEMDELLSAATGGSPRSSLSGRGTGALRTIDSDLDDMMSGINISSSAGKTSSSNVSSSSSSTKQVSKMSSISQSSMESVEGTGMEPKVSSSVKQSSSSLASTASMSSEEKIVDGKVVKAETLAEKASIANQAQKEKVVEDGKVLVDTGSRSETTSAGLLKATKAMSQEEIDSFFQNDPAIAGKPVEALNYDKDKNTFEVTLADLPEFSPKELTVKIVRDVITVYGIHEEVIDGGGFKMHQYVRKFTVPKGLDNNVEWKLNQDGALAITAGDTVKGGVSQVHLDCTIYKPRSFFKSQQK